MSRWSSIYATGIPWYIFSRNIQMEISKTLIVRTKILGQFMVTQNIQSPKPQNPIILIDWLKWGEMFNHPKKSIFSLHINHNPRNHGKRQKSQIMWNWKFARYWNRKKIISRKLCESSGSGKLCRTRTSRSGHNVTSRGTSPSAPRPLQPYR